MSAPWWAHALLLSPTTREIDNHYHVACIAKGVGEIREYQLAWFQNAQRTAARELSGGDTVSPALREMGTALVGSLGTISNTLDHIDASLVEGFAGIAEGLDELTSQMAELTEAVYGIHETLRNPQSTKAHELLAEARRAMNAGMTAQGRERDAEYNDALRLLDSALKNPLGQRMSDAWFHRGWLEWRHLGALDRAEESFFNAARLGREGSPEPRVLALRHLGEVRYARGDFAGALGATSEALVSGGSRPEVMYDGARYAARSGNRTLMLRWLSDSLDRWPFLSVVMLSDGDLHT